MFMTPFFHYHIYYQSHTHTSYQITADVMIYDLAWITCILVCECRHSADSRACTFRLVDPLRSKFIIDMHKYHNYLLFSIQGKCVFFGLLWNEMGVWQPPLDFFRPTSIIVWDAFWTQSQPNSGIWSIRIIHNRQTVWYLFWETIEKFAGLGSWPV